MRHQLTHNGETLSVPRWAKRLGMSPHTIYSRLRDGWSVERVLGPNRVERDRARIATDQPIPRKRVATARSEAREMVADAVGSALRGVSYASLNRRLGWNVSYSAYKAIREANVKISTLADIATAAGKRLVVTFQD